MARGRMISKSLSTSQRYAELGKVAGPLGEFAQSLFPLIVAHADDFGRLSGDAFTVKHLCHPTSRRSVSQFEIAILAMVKVGLILHSTEGVNRIQVNDFDAHQVGLNRRSVSKFQEIQGNSQGFPLNRTELKGRELNGTEPDDEQEVDSSNPPRMQRPGASIEPESRSPETTDRSAKLLERYRELFQQYRRGAKYFGRDVIDLPMAQKMVDTWDDAHLENMMKVFLTATRDEWINKTDRGFRVFSMKATLMDQWVREWEEKQRETA